MCFYNFSQTYDRIGFIWNPGLPSQLSVLGPLSPGVYSGGQQRPLDVRLPLPCVGVLQGIYDRALPKPSVPRTTPQTHTHHTHTLTALVIVFIEGLAANRSLLNSGAKIWFPGSAGHGTRTYTLQFQPFQLLRPSTGSHLQKWSKMFVFCSW